jgi:carbamoyltransferase
MKNVLGINCYLHDSSAALIQDGRIAFAAEEERFSRIKKDARFPKLAIRAALEHGGIEFGDLDAVAFGWNRGGVTPLHTLRSTLTGKLPFSMRYAADSLLSCVLEIYRGNGQRNLETHFGRPPRLFHIDHHDAHAWSTYALSGFDEALVIVLDGRGAFQATSMYLGQGGRLRPIKTIAYPNSLGSFYEAFTDLLGFQRHEDEWKVMGLAAYGQPTYDLGDALRLCPGGYRVNSHLVCGDRWRDLNRMVQRYGPRRVPELRITDADQNFAASVQRALEQAIFAVVADGIRRTGCRRICLAGGVAMNSKANGNLLASGLVEDLFVQPAATDDGTALGAALAVYAAVGASVPRYRLTEVYLGPEFSNAEIGTVLDTYRLRSTYCEDVEAVVAGLLAEGHIVGWFQGRMEFGPRALGNRSILADPRRAEMKDRLNACVKFRKGWRPFAPSCLAEAAGDYFEGCTGAPFMVLTFTVRPEKQRQIPAVTHADQTARVQTVTQEANPRYWRLLKAFEQRTGVPVLMNTSFNLRGEPIVCTPKDAIRTFYSSGLEFLVMGNYVLAKNPAWQPVRRGDLGFFAVQEACAVATI